MISVDGTPTPADTVTISIDVRFYGYAVTSADTLNTIRDALVALINSNGDEKVVATASGSFTRIILRAKVQGPRATIL